MTEIDVHCFEHFGGCVDGPFVLVLAAALGNELRGREVVFEHFDEVLGSGLVNGEVFPDVS